MNTWKVDKEQKGRGKSLRTVSIGRAIKLISLISREKKQDEIKWGRRGFDGES